MATKKGSAFYIGLALLVIGIISLLVALNVLKPFHEWWVPIILIIIGILVIINNKGICNILGWICLVYGVVLLLMTLGLFYVAFLWQIADAVFFILLGLILIL
jgi:hypothetical protein